MNPKKVRIARVVLGLLLFGTGLIGGGVAIANGSGTLANWLLFDISVASVVLGSLVISREE